MKTNNAAADLVWLLAALTAIVPATVGADEMTRNDVLDAQDGWDFAWTVDPATSGGLHLPDGRVLRRWA
jgi:hypothetical protein